MRMEHWWFTVPLRLRSILRGRRVEQELDEELQFHLEHKIEEGIANGLSPEEARYAAMRAMGGLEQRKEEMRDMRRIHWLTDFVDDVRYAIRSLRRTSGLTAFVVITLALGIGMTVGAVQHGRCADLPAVPGAASGRRGHAGEHVTRQQLRAVLLSRIPGHPRQDEELRRRDRQRATAQAVGFSAEPGATPRIKGGMLVSGNYFRVLGVEPQLGRGFRDDEDAGARPRRRGGARTGLLEARIRERPLRRRQDDSPERHGLHRDWRRAGDVPGHADLRCVPTSTCRWRWRRLFSTNPQKNFFEDRDDRELSVKARLKPGTTLQQAQSELAVLAQDFEREYPQLNRDRGAAVHTQFEMRTRDDDAQLEIRRDLRDPGAGGAAGGVHQRRGTSLEPRPHAHARNRRAAGAGRRAFPADPAAA